MECHIDITEPLTLIHFSQGTLAFDATSLSCWQLLVLGVRDTAILRLYFLVPSHNKRETV